MRTEWLIPEKIHTPTREGTLSRSLLPPGFLKLRQAWSAVNVKSKEQILKQSLTQLKLDQNRLRKSVDNLTKSHTKVLASSSSSMTAGKKRSADSGSEEDDQFNELENDEQEILHLAQKQLMRASKLRHPFISLSLHGTGGREPLEQD